MVGSLVGALEFIAGVVWWCMFATSFAESPALGSV